MGLGINPAGFTIHSAIHAARHDAICVLHTHTVAGIAIACQKQGLLPLNQWSLQFTDCLAYHDYEGIALDLDERSRLVADLGDKFVMVLRNHGMLTCGRSVAEAFKLMHNLERSCRAQLAVQSSGAENHPAIAGVARKTAGQYAISTTRSKPMACPTANGPPSSGCLSGPIPILRTDKRNARSAPAWRLSPF